MDKTLTKFLILALPALFALPCVAGNPAPANPYFSWKTLRQAKHAFAISNVTTTAKLCVFSNSNSSLLFYNGRRKAEVDSVTVWLNVAPEFNPLNQQWHMSTIDMDLISLSLHSQTQKEPELLKIVIDPGHGGDDSGAITHAKDLYEKDINLELAKMVGKILHRKGLKVSYTREKDITLTLSERSAIARRKKADLFVSFHANKASNTNACGVETFVLTPSGYHGTSQNSPPRGWQIGNKNDYNNNLLGYSIQRELVKLDHATDRGLKHQSFFVLRETHCPAALIEIGFLSNKDDILRMKSSKWKSECADKIVLGIVEYCRRVNSLNKAVAAKRKAEAEANERWLTYLTNKKRAGKQTGKTEIAKVHAVKSAVAATDTTIKKREFKNIVSTGTESKEAAKNGSLSIIDLHKICGRSVLSVATNIYLKDSESVSESNTVRNTEGLKNLVDFYETGKVK